LLARHSGANRSEDQGLVGVTTMIRCQSGLLSSVE
jgi:hypothetical protein